MSASTVNVASTRVRSELLPVEGGSGLGSPTLAANRKAPSWEGAKEKGRKRPSGVLQPMAGAARATGIDSTVARSRGKLWALRSCITSKPRLARLITSAQVLITRP
jgi:hypothetical protein